MGEVVPQIAHQCNLLIQFCMLTVVVITLIVSLAAILLTLVYMPKVRTYKREAKRSMEEAKLLFLESVRDLERQLQVQRALNMTRENRPESWTTACDIILGYGGARELKVLGEVGRRADAKKRNVKEWKAVKRHALDCYQRLAERIQRELEVASKPETPR